MPLACPACPVIACVSLRMLPAANVARFLHPRPKPKGRISTFATTTASSAACLHGATPSTGGLYFLTWARCCKTLVLGGLSAGPFYTDADCESGRDSRLGSDTDEHCDIRAVASSPHGANTKSFEKNTALPRTRTRRPDFCLVRQVPARCRAK